MCVYVYVCMYVYWYGVLGMVREMCGGRVGGLGQRMLDDALMSLGIYECVYVCI
jgi:hypothetical protein